MVRHASMVVGEISSSLNPCISAQRSLKDDFAGLNIPLPGSDIGSFDNPVEPFSLPGQCFFCLVALEGVGDCFAGQLHQENILLTPVVVCLGCGGGKKSGQAVLQDERNDQQGPDVGRF